MSATAKSTEVDKNFEAFEKMLPELLKTHPGKFAVMHRGEIVEFFDSLGDAVRCGKSRFEELDFSVQEVTSRNVNLGFYTYLMTDALPHISN